MKTKKEITILRWILIVALGSFSQAEPVLNIYLPREVQVVDETITLGEICVIRGEADIVEQAERINLGRLSMPLKEMTVSRAMMLGRLTNSGFEARDIEITGAEKVIVTQRRRIIRAERIRDEAESFLKRNFPDKSVCRYEAIGNVDDFVLLAEAGKTELLPSLVAASSNDRMRVSVALLADGRNIGAREVEFQKKYFCREAVALRPIAQGEIITKDNVEVTQKISSSAQRSDWQEPYGLAAKRPIPANAAVTQGMVGPVQREVLVKRNRHVTVIFDRPGLSMTAVGKALEDGRAGDYIKVRMQIKDSPRIIYARVNDNGTVEPLI